MAGITYFGKNARNFENELDFEYANDWISEERYLESTAVFTDKAKKIDALNIKKERNENNTDSMEYNCMGYALDFYGWGLPVGADFDKPEEIIDELDLEYSDELVEEIADALYDRDYSYPILMDLAIKRMLEAFNGKLRRINDINEATEDEVVVVYRGGDGDFHFAKIEDGVISHKMGNCLIETADDLEDCFSDRYCSDNVFFARSF